LTAYHDLRGTGNWVDEREHNLVDGGAPFYRTYATADDGFVAVGCLDPRGWRSLLDRLALDAELWPQHDRRQWPAQRDRLASIFGADTDDILADLGLTADDRDRLRAAGAIA